MIWTRGVTTGTQMMLECDLPLQDPMLHGSRTTRVLMQTGLVDTGIIRLKR